MRALLAETPTRGRCRLTSPARIELALADEARLRVGRGPLPDAGGEPVADMAGRAGGVVRLAGRRPAPSVGRRRRGGRGGGRGGRGCLGAARHPASEPGCGHCRRHEHRRTDRDQPCALARGDQPHIQLSTTDYTAATLAAQARALLDDPATPLADLAAESPSLGPIATPVGLASCLDALGAVPSPATVTADLGDLRGPSRRDHRRDRRGHEHGVCRRAQLLPRQRHRAGGPHGACPDAGPAVARGRELPCVGTTTA